MDLFRRKSQGQPTITTSAWSPSVINLLSLGSSVAIINIIILMTSSLEQIKQATKRKSTGFFFIKSKHVHPTFKNHTYFEMKPKIRTQESQSELSYKNNQEVQTEGMKGNHGNRWRMWVDQPSSYGIQNTYRYMCDRIKMGNRRNVVLKMIEKDKGEDKEKQKEKEKSEGHEKVESNTLLNTITTHKQNRKQSRQRMHSEPTNKYLETTQSFNYRIRKSKNYSQQPKIPEASPANADPNLQQAEHMIEMIYIPGRSSSFIGNMAEDNNKICFNILPYIINCFFKCKINYHKKLAQADYNDIKRFIEEIKGSTKSYFDVKDIINLSTVQEVLEILRIYGEGTLEWTETVRYFFMPSEDVLSYQFDKMIDEIKIMSIMKFNAELSHQPLYIYRVEDRLKICNVYDMLKPGTYIYSENKACYEIYCGIIKRRAEIFSYKNRIKKWRNVAPLDETSSLCASDRKNSITNEQNDKNTIQKYQKLYQLRKERRKKHSTKRHHVPSNGIMITTHVNTSFIDKSKLHHSEDIFQ